MLKRFIIGALLLGVCLVCCGEASAGCRKHRIFGRRGGCGGALFHRCR